MALITPGGIRVIWVSRVKRKISKKNRKTKRQENWIILKMSFSNSTRYRNCFDTKLDDLVAKILILVTWNACARIKLKLCSRYYYEDLFSETFKSNQVFWYQTSYVYNQNLRKVDFASSMKTYMYLYKQKNQMQNICWSILNKTYIVKMFSKKESKDTFSRQKLLNLSVRCIYWKYSLFAKEPYIVFIFLWPQTNSVLN